MQLLEVSIDLYQFVQQAALPVAVLPVLAAACHFLFSVCKPFGLGL
jgi:hypothetical protein